jgi:hypothetical protein
LKSTIWYETQDNTKHMHICKKRKYLLRILENTPERVEG